MPRIEIFPLLAPVQIRMKRYCFKRSDDCKISRSPLNPCMEQEFDILHVGDEPNLVRYFEKLVEDEVSGCNSLHDSHDPNLMQPSQINTGETVQDCIDFDELLNDVHSTAASAQLLRLSLSGSSEPSPFP